MRVDNRNLHWKLQLSIINNCLENQISPITLQTDWRTDTVKYRVAWLLTDNVNYRVASLQNVKFKFREWRERQMARLCEKDKQEEEDRQKLKENAAKVGKQN